MVRFVRLRAEISDCFCIVDDKMIALPEKNFDLSQFSQTRGEKF